MKATAGSQRPLVRRSAAVLAWWCALYPLWFLFSGEGGWLTAAWGAAAAAVAAVAAQLVTGREFVTGRPGVRWASDLLSAARQTVLDFGLITAVLARSIVAGRRGPVGHFVRRDIPRTAGGTVSGVAAWLSVVATYSPNAYVIDVDPGSGRVLLHDLRPRRTSEEPV